MTDNLNQSVESALKAFNEVKDMVTGFDKKLKDISPKMDAFDVAKFNRLQEDIASGIEESQKQAARVKSLEDQKAASEAKAAELEKDLIQLKTALNRAPSGSEADKGKEAKAQINKLFNQFARSSRSTQEDFSEFLEKSNAPEEVKALSTGSDPDGGFLTLPEFGGIIQTQIYESSPIRQLASVVTTSSDTYEYVLDYGQAGGEWVSEASSGSTGTTPKIGKASIPVHDLAAKPQATQRMLDDGIIDVEAWLGNKAAEWFARAEATTFVSGNGVGQPRGILTYAAGTDITAAQIEQVVSGSASGLTYDGMVNLQNALKEDYQANAAFLIKRATNAALMLIKDGQGHPVFNLTFDKNVGMRPTIMGQPVYFGNDMPTVQANALAVAYGDFKRAYRIVDRVGIRVLRDPYTVKPFVMFYTTKRVGGAVINYEAIKIGKVST
jgi:HK97 family phage major capsid protein